MNKKSPLDVFKLMLNKDWKTIGKNIIHGNFTAFGKFRDFYLRNQVIKVGDSYKYKPDSGSVFFSDYKDLKYLLMEEKYSKKLINATKKAQVFADVGSFHGFYSVMSKASQNYVFEPDPDNLRVLKENLKLNKDKNFFLTEKGVWSENTTLTFDSGQGGKSSISEQGKTQIETVSLDSFFEGKEKPDVIKIDVEGAEGNVLKGAKELLKSKKPKLFIEWHVGDRLRSFGYTREGLESFLTDFGYQRVWKKERGGEIHSVYEACNH